MVNYSELSDLLRQSRSATCAADCHGFLCAQVCVNEFSNRHTWEEYLGLESNDEFRADECTEEINTLISEIRKLFISPDFDFQLLLPDDDTPLSDRVSALGEWCHGFLNGFALGQNARDILEDEESRELFENFTRICRVGVDEIADEDDEQALLELSEYVRLGTMYIFDCLQPETASIDRPEIFH